MDGGWKKYLDDAKAAVGTYARLAVVILFFLLVCEAVILVVRLLLG